MGFLPQALIRSNMSSQIRQLINQGRDQSSPLTDGETVAGGGASSSFPSSSVVSEEQNKTEGDVVASGEAESL